MLIREQTLCKQIGFPAPGKMGKMVILYFIP
jgi:hypothetical protein